VAKSFPTVYPTGRRPKPFFHSSTYASVFFPRIFFKKCSYCHFTLAACEQAWHSRDRDLVNLLNCSFFAVLRNNSITRQARFLVSPVGYVVFARSLSHFTLSLSLYFSISRKRATVNPALAFLEPFREFPVLWFHCITMTIAARFEGWRFVEPLSGDQSCCVQSSVRRFSFFSFVKNIKINKNDVRMSSQQGVIQILDILAQMFVPKHPEFLPRPKKNPLKNHTPTLIQWESI